MSHAEQITVHQARYHIESHYQAADTPQAQFIGLPPVQIVDMRQELREGNRHIFSRALQAALADVLNNQQQAILFLNRRGSATFVLCRDCGHVMICPRCDLPLTYHEKLEDGARSSEPEARKAAGENNDAIRNTDYAIRNTQYALLCHLCSHHESPPAQCPKCKSVRIKFFGLGTQRVEKTVSELFPQAKVLRWDADTTSGKGAHELFLQQFIEGQANIMVGTQMIAKGLDLPLVTLVGVISADTSLRLPDLRAAERTFQLLAQVAGRAGRGLLGGQVIVQTYTPDHYAVQEAVLHNYTGFAQKELAFRFEQDYPPFTRLARLVTQHTNARRAEREAERLAAELRPVLETHGLNADALIGPAPCFVARIREQYRWQIILRAPDPAAILRHVSFSPAWRVDIDPLNLL
jgi:primosomal protein N' (replication factor Y)